jgi:zinc protease
VASARPAPDESFRAHAPEPGPSAEFVPTAATRTQLHDGIPVFVVKQASPFVAIRLVAIGGVADVGSDHAEALALMLALMRTGTTNRSWVELRQAYAADSITEPGFAVGPDAISMTIEAPVGKLRRAVELLSDVALHPLFEEKEVPRMRLAHASLRENDGNDLLGIADRALRRQLFGTHPYASVWGTPAQIRALGRADLVPLHARMFQPSRMAFFVCGDVEPDDVTQALDGAFGTMPVGGAAPRPLPEPHLPKGPRLLLVDKPGATIAAISVGFPGPAWPAPDVHAAIIANDALADVGSGRLTQRLRVEASAVPWVTVNRYALRSGGALGWHTRVATDRVVQVLEEAERATRAFASQGPTDQEFAAIRDRAAYSFAAAFEATPETARIFAEAWVAGEPPDALVQRPRRVAALGVEDVRAVAARYFDVDRMRVVVVGDASALVAPLGALGWGPIDVRDAQLRPAAARKTEHAAR